MKCALFCNTKCHRITTAVWGVFQWETLGAEGCVEYPQPLSEITSLDLSFCGALKHTVLFAAMSETEA